MCFAQGPQRSDASEPETHGPSFSSQALYHWATALPKEEDIAQACSGDSYMYMGESFQDYSWIQDFEDDFPQKAILKILNSGDYISFFDLFSVCLRSIDS